MAAIRYSMYIALVSQELSRRQQAKLFLVTMSYNKLMTSDTNNVLTFKRKLLNMTVITNKHYFLLEELG